MTLDVNAEIGEKIMGWEVDRKQLLYRDLTEQTGFMQKLPDFLLGPSNELLRETMKDRGYELTVTETQADFQKKIGRTFTARFSRQNQSFQTKQADENTAVCLAALKAYGFQLSNDH